MIFVIQDKIYDTEKAENVLDYFVLQPVELPGTSLVFKNKVPAKLYKTKKGNWFTVKNKKEEYTATAISESEVKEIFKKLNEVELYNKHFSELEEA